jgi:SAM-dependent methyltransferase
MEKFVVNYLSKFGNEILEIIDIGSQDVNGSYKSLFGRNNWRYHGCDVVEGENVDIVLSSPYNWKNVSSDYYDVVISGQTFEHIEYFWITILEICRILKEGGICCIIAPSAGVEHGYPVDCWRFYPAGFKALTRYAGLDLLEVYTQWNEQLYPDYDSLWKDTVLICKKPVMTVNQKLKFHLKNIISKTILTLDI